MVRTDESALLCDMAETYHIYDSWSESPIKITRYALFANGLRDNSRIKMKIAGMRVDTQTFLQAAQVDLLQWLKWAKTIDGEKNINHPKSIVDILMGKDEKMTNGDKMIFASPEDFERELERLQGA